MVKGIDGKNQQIITLKGQKQNIDTTKLEGLKKTEQNKAIFDRFDEDKNGTLDKKEADNMQNWLQKTAGNQKLSRREMKKSSKEAESFDALSKLAQQQEEVENGKEYIEINSQTTTHIVKIGNKLSKYDEMTNEEGTIIRTFDDGTKELKYKDGTSDEIDKDGAITKFDANDKKTAYIKDGLTTTFSPDGNISTTRDSSGKILTEIELKDGKEVKTEYEYSENKIIQRQSVDGELESVTISNSEGGHSIDTVYKSEEDMKNNHPSERIVDAQNPALMTITKYTYDDKGNVKIETTDASGKVTTTFQNDKGETIENPDKNSGKTTYTVQKGDSITKIVKDALKAQGIEKPTAEQLSKAKKEFLELNKDLVKTYNGVRQEWKGNKFFYPNDVVKIPDFNKETKPDNIQDKPEVKLSQTQKDALDKLLKDDKDKQLEQKRDDLAKILQDGYDINIENGKIVVKDKQGNVLDGITTIVNDDATNEDDVNTMLKSDANGNKKLELEEFKVFIESQLKTVNFEITDENKTKITEIITKHFNNIDTDNKDGLLTKEELQKNATTVIQNLTDELGEI